MREHYIEQMNKVIEAYSDEHIEEFKKQVMENGLGDHGFPRLTATLGILIAHGKRLDFKERFVEMMNLCCKEMPVNTHGANDFAIREIIHSILELEESGVYPKEYTDRWREAFKGLDPLKIYRAIAPAPAKKCGNWAAFNGASEQLKIYSGIGGSEEFIERQLASQVLAFDENGMYMDPNEPMLYDSVTRMQLENCILFGYRGKFYKEIEENLKKSGILSLYMQSVTGEMAYGGRSNQMLFNEAVLCAVFEYEAVRYKKEGNMEKAAEFKRAAEIASNAFDKYLFKKKLSHVKNGYPPLENYGCENYAHFDKYMVTSASFIYCAYLFADDSIKPAKICTAEKGGYIFETSDAFHKLFANAFGYMLEFDYRADSHYDCTGLGRIHKADAPSEICLSVPVSLHPMYKTDGENTVAMSICGGVKTDDGFEFATSRFVAHKLTKRIITDDEVTFGYNCTLQSGEIFDIIYSIKKSGVDITVKGDGKTVGIMLPVFRFDGNKSTEVSAECNQISINYEGHICRYQTEGDIIMTNEICSNRNGQYEFSYAQGKNEVSVHIEIE